MPLGIKNNLVFHLQKLRNRKPVVRELWAVKCQETQAFYSVGAYYYDKKYQCIKCQALAIYSAKDQKYSLEVAKNHIWQNRILCSMCFAEKQVVIKELKDIEQQWKNNSDRLKSDEKFLQNWANLLVARSDYRGSYHSAHHNRVKNLLKKIKEKKQG